MRCRNFLYVNVGTGIAVGLVLGGKLYRGAANLAGEWGHTTVDRHGTACVCGLRGCVEAVASGDGIIRELRRRLEEMPDETMEAALKAGRLRASDVLAMAERNPSAHAVFLDAVENLGLGIVNLVNFLNPDAVVFGGGVFRGSGTFLDEVSRYIKTHALADAVAALRYVGPTRLGVENAGLVGAAALAWGMCDRKRRAP